MNIAAVIDPTAAAASSRRDSRPVAHVEILHDMRDAEQVWRALEFPPQFSTPYQRFDFQAAWQQHIGVRENLRPFIVVAYDSGHQPLMLLPLVVKQHNGVKTATFLGGKHVTFNMPLWQHEFAVGAGKADLDLLIESIKASNEVDVLALTRQPHHWMGVANPMSVLPNQPSTNDCPLLIMTPGGPPADLISNSFRRRLKGKERKLQSLPGYRYGLARTDAEIKRTLDAFFTIKPQRMAEQKLPNVFAETGVEDFIRDACAAPVAGGGHAIDIHALECDDEVIAIFAGVADGSRFSMMFNTYTLSGNSKYSPGLILMREIIDHYAALGYKSFDLGIGSDEYKRLFCKSDELIFDSFIPLTFRGKLAAAGMASIAHGKRVVKQNPALMHMAQRIRGAFQR
jgi:CelD/BcsL family acetyltransferase involved in cellulose biosynthesis